MPKSPTAQPKEQLTIRFAERWMGQLRKRAEDFQKSMSDVVEELVEDHFAMFRLPEDAVDALREDMKKAGKKDQREYVVSLLMKRYLELASEGSKAASSKK